MNRKLLAILIVIIALIILIALIYFIFLAPVPEEKAVKEPEVIAEVKTSVPDVPAAEPARPAVRTAAVTENDLKRMAGAFVERYGSYSNQSGYGNIKNLQIFMSRSMQNWALDYVEQAKAKEAANEIYYGISTKTVVVETQRFSESATLAEFIVKTQREESIGVGGNSRGFQQDAQVVMIKERGVWKVDRVIWVE